MLHEDESTEAGRCFLLSFFARIAAALIDTVEPVYNGHPWDLRNWPLNTGGRLIQGH